MDFGITLPNFGKYADKNKIIKIASAAQELEFDSVWVSDHIIIPDTHEGFGNVFYDPIVTLSYLASITKKIKLGTSVIILPYRNPVVFAKMVSTLDQLSDGRIILGIGAGWLEKEFQALGIAFNKRGEMTDESLKVLKTLWTQESPSFTGKNFKFSDIKFLPKPIQKPYPPIWIGGGSDKAIERAVTYGNGWHPVSLTPEKLKEKLFIVQELLRNQKKENFVISLRRNLEITDKEIDDHDTLRGSVEKIVRGLKEYKNIGVDHLLLHFLSGTSDGVLNAMKRFSKEIRPLI
jgi:probable F420-dependent oxidoreductase